MVIVGTCRQKDEQDTILDVQNIEDSYGAWGSLQTSGRSGQYKKLWGVLMDITVVHRPFYAKILEPRAAPSSAGVQDSARNTTPSTSSSC